MVVSVDTALFRQPVRSSRSAVTAALVPGPEPGGCRGDGCPAKEASDPVAALNVRELGDFIRDQRRTAQISLRQLAKQAGVSNPYLSQIERGLRRPSAEILQQIAKALRISAEVLYVQAGILEERHGGENVSAAVLADDSLSERQKQVVLDIYEAFCRENAVAGRISAEDVPAATDPLANDLLADAQPVPCAPAVPPPTGRAAGAEKVAGAPTARSPRASTTRTASTGPRRTRAGSATSGTSTASTRSSGKAAGEASPVSSTDSDPGSGASTTTPPKRRTTRRAATTTRSSGSRATGPASGGGGSTSAGPEPADGTPAPGGDGSPNAAAHGTT
jgi:transcriptional regulator with XRE-family HTH domain